VFGLDSRQSAESGGQREPAGLEMTWPSNGARRAGAAPAAGLARLQPFEVEVQQRNGVAIVQPRGELDLATVETLSDTLDGIDGAGRLVLDLRGLSFIDSTGLRLLVSLYQRSQRDGFELMLVAPAAPTDRAIQLCGLDQALPFVDAVDAVEGDPARRAREPFRE
jgi:anti-sigma B factor antagonist